MCTHDFNNCSYLASYVVFSHLFSHSRVLLSPVRWQSKCYYPAPCKWGVPGPGRSRDLPEVKNRPRVQAGPPCAATTGTLPVWV